MQVRALMVEDDPSVREIAAIVLERAGLDVTTAADGEEALERFRQDPFDLVILDLMLPKVGGFDLCRTIRQTSQVPIVMLTARTDTAALVTGLELGADDYVTKPFKPPELVARIRAVLRRAEPTTAEGAGGDAGVRAGPLLVDPAACRASLHGRPLSLTATELRLLVELMRNAGRPLDRRHPPAAGVELRLPGRLPPGGHGRARLREKLGDDPRTPAWITTVRGVGYRFDVPIDDA